MSRQGSGPPWRPSRRAVLLGALLLVTGCAYYNTFYFAKRYYGEAERMRQQSSSEKLPPDAIRRYDSAILQCKKVLNFHGGSRWVDDAVYLMGASYYGKAEYDSALLTFDQLLVGFPKSNLVPKAQYMRGLCFHERRQFDQMEEAFNKALAADPDLKQRDDILFTLAKSAEDQLDYPGAIRKYRELVRTYPGTKRGEDGLMEIGRLYFDSEQYDSSFAAYEELAGATENDDTYQEAQLQAARSLIRLGRAGDAIDRMEKLLPKGTARPKAGDDWPPRVEIVLAEAYNSEGEPGKAIEALQTVTKSYATSTYATEAQYQIGYTYEAYMDSLTAAETAYDKASRMSARSSFKDLARDRLADVKKLIALSSEVEGEDSDQEKAGEAALKIAELFYFSERKYDEAIRKYRQVIRDHPGTASAPKAAYAVAWIHLRDLETTRDSALVELHDLVRDYPASKQARGAIGLLADEGADTTGLASLLIEPEPDTVAAAVSAETLPDDFIGPPSPAQQAAASAGELPEDFIGPPSPAQQAAASAGELPEDFIGPPSPAQQAAAKGEGPLSPAQRAAAKQEGPPSPSEPAAPVDSLGAALGRRGEVPPDSGIPLIRKMEVPDTDVTVPGPAVESPADSPERSGKHVP